MVRPRNAKKVVSNGLVNGDTTANVRVYKKRGRKSAKEAAEIEEANLAKKIKLQLSAPDVTDGVVMTFGMGDIGQLGLGPDVEEKSRPAVVTDIKNVVAVAAGGLHTVTLTKEGKVYTWGCNDEGALGRNTPTEEDAFTSGLVDIEGKVVQISAGDCHTAALTEDGRVFAWGCFRDNSGPLGFMEKGLLQKTPRPLLEGTPITKVTSGNNHLAMLSQDGRVFTCGCGESGQLGRIAEMFATRDSRNGKGIETQLEPHPIKICVRNKPIVLDDVWAGGMTLFVRAKNTGNIYGCGLNNYNQLGDDDTGNKFQPELLKSFKGKTWIQISGGQHHSLALMEDGEAHSIGRHEYGRLGLGDIGHDVKVPTLITELKNNPASTISAGECMSVVVTRSGTAYAFGMGTNMQLGQGNDEDQLSPAEVKGKQLEGRKVLAASAGGQHTVLLAAPK